MGKTAAIAGSWIVGVKKGLAADFQADLRKQAV
jgi:hypothetical protein